jgi:hypothetical protein
MDRNLSKERMTADLESMKTAGIGMVIFLEAMMLEFPVALLIS